MRLFPDADCDPHALRQGASLRGDPGGLRRSSRGSGLCAGAAFIALGCMLGSDVGCQPHNCGEVQGGCSWDVGIGGDLGLSSSTAAHLQVVACRAGACSEGVLDAEPPASPGQGAAASAELPGATPVVCGVHACCDTPPDWSFACSFHLADDIESGRIEAGDIEAVRIEVRDLDTGNVLVDFNDVASYQERGGDGACPECIEVERSW